VVAFAVIDDLGAIVLIAVFYTVQLSPGFLLAAFAVWGVLLALNLIFRIHALLPYIVGGAAMWFLMLKSGVHATIAGVLLAFAIPFARANPEQPSASNRLEGLLHKPVAFVILPIFALANTAIVVHADWMQQLGSENSLGIIAGLILGKPLGVLCFCGLAIAIGLCQLPPQVKWPHMVCAGLLGGIGFTMSIFIANLAFSGYPGLINESKMAILAASSTAAVLGFVWLIAWDRLAQPKLKS
jgi:NhaA family Na+:H+ antiporter